MSTFGALNIARLGLSAQSRALQVTSNNIANVNTPGYSRQRPIFEPFSSGLFGAGFPPGGGVEVSTIERVADANIDAQLRNERQEFGLDQGLETGLSQIEAIFDELGGSGISAALSEFFAGLNDLANDPANPTVRESVVRAGETLTSLIRDADRRLAQVQIDENARIAQTSREITEIAADIAELNGQIVSKEIGDFGNEAAALRDRREVLLNELSEKVDHSAYEGEDGSVSVFAAGGFLLVEGLESASFEVRTGAGGNPAFYDVFQNLGGSINGPITSRVYGGQLGASIALRDDRVVAYRNALDEFAFTLSARTNAVHYQPGVPPGALGIQDDVARRFFVDTNGVAVPEGADFTAVSGAAASIGVHADVIANPRHLAAGAGPAGGGPAASSDNTVALELARLETQGSTFYQVGDAVGAPSGTPISLGGFFDNLSGSLGAELASTRRALTQSELIVADLEERRGAFSGVSLDEELANLVRFERAYQASARVLQTMNDLLDTLTQL